MVLCVSSPRNSFTINFVACWKTLIHFAVTSSSLFPAVRTTKHTLQVLRVRSSSNLQQYSSIVFALIKLSPVYTSFNERLVGAISRIVQPPQAWQYCLMLSESILNSPTHFTNASSLMRLQSYDNREGGSKMPWQRVKSNALALSAFLLIEIATVRTPHHCVISEKGCLFKGRVPRMR